MPIHKSILGFATDIITDFIPGGDRIDDFLFGGGSPSQVTQPMRIAAGRGGDRSTLGSFEGLVPDPIERLIGTMPALGANGGQGVGNCQITAPLQLRERAACRPGFVAVDSNGDGVTDVCMKKEVAIACKLWKRRPKPLLTSADRRILTRSVGVMKKVDNVVKQTNTLRGQARLVKKTRSSK